MMTREDVTIKMSLLHNRYPLIIIRSQPIFFASLISAKPTHTKANMISGNRNNKPT